VPEVALVRAAPLVAAARRALLVAAEPARAARRALVVVAEPARAARRALLVAAEPARAEPRRAVPVPVVARAVQAARAAPADERSVRYFFELPPKRTIAPIQPEMYVSLAPFATF
jgi:hypothetical protein